MATGFPGSLTGLLAADPGRPSKTVSNPFLRHQHHPITSTLPALPIAVVAPSTDAAKTSLPFAEDSLLAAALAKGGPRRPRGEKRPIPEEHKDKKYFERRKRNNLAAKKSRDQRKLREESVTNRAQALEKENAILRAQVSTLREELSSLQSLLAAKRQKRKDESVIRRHLAVAAAMAAAAKQEAEEQKESV